METFSQVFLKTFVLSVRILVSSVKDLEDRHMFRTLFILLLLSPAATMAQSWFDGNPDFADDASKQLAFEVLAAHGGMQAMNEASGLEFNFFTKNL